MNKYVATSKNALPVTRVFVVSQLAPNPAIAEEEFYAKKKRDSGLHDVRIFRCGLRTPPLFRHRKYEASAATVMVRLSARGPANALSAD